MSSPEPSGLPPLRSDPPARSLTESPHDRPVPRSAALRRHGHLAARRAVVARRRSRPPDRGRRLPAVLGRHRTRRRHGGRAATQAVHERALLRPRDRGSHPGGRRTGPAEHPHAHPHGCARPREVPASDRRLVQAVESRPDERTPRRTERAGLPEDGRRRRSARLLPRRRDALPAPGDPGDPRTARIRLRPHAEAHPGAVRRLRPRSRARRVTGGDQRRPPRLLRLLHGPDRRSPGEPEHRPGDVDRERHDRRRTDAGPRADGVLHHRRDRRPRHHGRVDVGGHASARHRPGGAGAAPGRTRPDPERRRRDDPALLARPPFHAHGTGGHRDRGPAHRQGRLDHAQLHGGQPRPDHLRRPLRFDVARPNADKHIAFGFGVHFCLGAQLARMELRSLYRHLIPRLASVELDGEPATVKAVFVSGHKRLPIRYELAA
ncbi:MAG: cytochrome P450 [Ilumatobacter sp.]|nr:cytochrome P450 [Ilumatobacter sp.]